MRIEKRYARFGPFYHYAYEGSERSLCGFLVPFAVPPRRTHSHVYVLCSRCDYVAKLIHRREGS